MYPLPVIKVLFQGKPLTQQFYNEHPEIHSLYPSQERFMQEIYLPLCKMAQETNMEQVVEISESGVYINGVRQ